MNADTHRHLYFRKRFAPGTVVDPKMEGLCCDSAGHFIWAKRAGLEANDQVGTPRVEELSRRASQIASALDTQIGGSHYKAEKLQPIEACYQRYGYEGVKAALHCKVDKYLTRDKEGQDDFEQLQKAEHCIQLLLQFYKKDRENL